MGNFLLQLLIAEYVVIAGVYVWEGNVGKALYFVGAIILSVGVLLQK